MPTRSYSLMYLDAVRVIEEGEWRVERGVHGALEAAVEDQQLAPGAFMQAIYRLGEFLHRHHGQPAEDLAPIYGGKVSKPGVRGWRVRQLDYEDILIKWEVYASQEDVISLLRGVAEWDLSEYDYTQLPEDDILRKMRKVSRS